MYLFPQSDVPHFGQEELMIAENSSEGFDRVFPSERAVERTAARGATAVQRHAQRGAAEHDALQAQIAGLREVAELLRRQLEDVRADRDAWREQAQAGQRLLAPADRKPWWRRIVG
jgi:hypothetical protein